MLEHGAHYIGGQRQPSKGKDRIEVVNAATEEVIGSIPAGNAEDADMAVWIIEVILMALPSVVESNWKSIAHTTFGASASTGGIEDTPARLRGLCARTCSPSSRHSRWICFLLTSRRSS